MTRIPSTQALRALESFARHGTVWKAAEELNLTRSAVSHQLRLLERDLGFRLLDRVGTRVELTPAGISYANDVRRALSMISGAAARNAGRGLSGTLTVSCTPGLASAWLCPRIGRFRETCPDIALSIITPRRLDDTSNPDVDLFLAFGSGNLPDMEVDLLREVEFTPLCSPALINRLGGLAEPREALRAGLLHLQDHGDWAAWFRLAGVEEGLAGQGLVFSDMNLVHAAALNGQGIAMGDEFICRGAMDAGALVRPFDLAIRSPRAYHIVVPREKTGNPAVEAFRSWLDQELRAASA